MPLQASGSAQPERALPEVDRPLFIVAAGCRMAKPVRLLDRQDGKADEAGDTQSFPRWSLLAAETWETAHSVIVRVELPGMNKEDIDVSIHGNLLRIRGEKRSGGNYQNRLYRLTERAYGRFERTIPIPHGIDGPRAEVSYVDGVITVILPKTEAIPPRQLTIP